MTSPELYHALGVGGYEATRCGEKEGVFCLQREAIRRCVVASVLVEMTPLSGCLFSAVRWHSQSKYAS